MIEEQARASDPAHGPEMLAEEIDAARFPLAARTVTEVFDPDPAVAFEEGLLVVLDGLRVRLDRSSP